MATREQNIAKIRNAVYGREVREAIAEGMEQTYDACEEFATEIEEVAENLGMVEVCVSGTTLYINTRVTDANEVSY